MALADLEPGSLRVLCVRFGGQTPSGFSETLVYESDTVIVRSV